MIKKNNQINSTTLQKQVVLNFLINFTQKMEQFITPPQNISFVSTFYKYKNNNNRNIINSSSKRKQNNSVSKNKQEKAQLQQISQNKQISLIQSINLKTLDYLTKSMQKGLNKSQISKQSQKLLSVFRTFIEQIKKSQQDLITNINTENINLQKQFDIQKQTINRLQKQCQNLKNKASNLNENQKVQNSKLKNIELLHRKCESNQNIFKKQIEIGNTRIKQLQVSLSQKQTKIKQLSQQLKSLDNQRKQAKRTQYQTTQKESNQAKSLQKQFKALQTQINVLQNKNKQVEQQNTSKSQLITQLEQKVKLHQNNVNEIKRRYSQFQQVRQRLQKSILKHQTTIELKQKTIQQLNLKQVLYLRKVSQFQFIFEQFNKQKTKTIQQSQQQAVNTVKNNQTINRLQQTITKLQNQNQSLNTQTKRWKQKYQKCQIELNKNIKQRKLTELSQQKKINQLSSQVEYLHLQKQQSLQEINKLYKQNTLNVIQLQKHTYQSLVVSENQSKITQLSTINNQKLQKYFIQRQTLIKQENNHLQAKYQNLLKQYFELKHIKTNYQDQNEQIKSKLIGLQQKNIILQKYLTLITRNIKRMVMLLSQNDGKMMILQKIDIKQPIDQGILNSLLIEPEIDLILTSKNTLLQSKKCQDVLKDIKEWQNHTINHLIIMRQLQKNVNKSTKQIRQHQSNEQILMKALIFGNEIGNILKKQNKNYLWELKQYFGSMKKHLSRQDILQRKFFIQMEQRQMISKKQIDVDKYDNEDNNNNDKNNDKSNDKNSDYCKKDNQEQNVLQSDQNFYNIHNSQQHFEIKIINESIVLQNFKQFIFNCENIVSNIASMYQDNIRENEYNQNKLKQTINELYIQKNKQIQKIKQQYVLQMKQKQDQYQQLINNLKFQLYQPQIQLLNQQISLLKHQFIENIDNQNNQNNNNYLHQIKLKDKQISSKQLKISQITRQNNYLTQKLNRQINKNYQLTAQLTHSSQTTKVLTNKTNQLHKQLIWYKEFQQKKWTQQIQDINKQMSIKSNSLQQANNRLKQLLQTEIKL